MTTDPLSEMSMSQLRDAWVEELGKVPELNCDDMRTLLRERGFKAKGFDRKGQIKNIHSAAINDDRIVKARPGVFTLHPAHR
jgi:hypothetical protein